MDWSKASNRQIFEAVEERLEEGAEDLLVLELAIRLGVDGWQGLRTTNEWHPAAARLREHVAMWEQSGAES